MLFTCAQEMLYLDASLYEHRSVELLSDVSMSLVWHLAMTRVFVMHAGDAVPGRIAVRVPVCGVAD